MSQTTEIWVKLVICIIAAVIVIRQEYVTFNRKNTPLLILAVLSVLAYYNWGKFHGNFFSHRWEHFHYTLNSKYFSELGYYGLYAASLEAQVQVAPRIPINRNIRDLHTYNVVHKDSLNEFRKEIVTKFTADRWKSFLRDHRYFLKNIDVEHFSKIRLDHGFNATPTWIFTARLFTGFLDITQSSIGFLSSLDLILLALMFLIIYKTYGSRILLFSLIIFGLGYSGRYFWVGGAFLRQTWLVSLVIGACMFKQKRYGISGGLLAYSAMLRIFPILFLFPLGVVALSSFVNKKIPNWFTRFTIGFLISLILCFGSGTLVGRGPGVWQEFVKNISRHSDTWLNNNVGFQLALLYGPKTYTRELVDWNLKEPWENWMKMMSEQKDKFRIPIALASIIFLFILGAAVWKSEGDGAIIMGMITVFIMVSPTNYYWLMLLAVPLKLTRKWLVPLLLILNIILCCIHLTMDMPIHEIIYGIMSWTLIVLFLAWTLPDAYRNIRGLPPMEPIPVESKEKINPKLSRKEKRAKERQIKKRNRKKRNQ